VLLQLAAYSSPGVDGDVGADSEAKNFISLAIYKVPQPPHYPHPTPTAHHTRLVHSNFILLSRAA
jgi:hypothetical protein